MAKRELKWWAVRIVALKPYTVYVETTDEYTARIDARTVAMSEFHMPAGAISTKPNPAEVNQVPATATPINTTALGANKYWAYID